MSELGHRSSRTDVSSAKVDAAITSLVENGDLDRLVQLARRLAAPRTR